MAIVLYTCILPVVPEGERRVAKQFFDEAKEQSEVKSAIVRKYFKAWATAIKSTVNKYGSKKIAYLDLFAGPGRYKDGTTSTPLLVLKEAIDDPDLRQMLVTIFNDKNEDNSKSLQAAIESLPGIETLKYKPQVDNEEVGSEIVKEFEGMSFVPTLFFVDPWGYKGLSLKLINSVLKDWACECIFFFNYTRINMGLANPIVREHMNALFGEERADELRPKLETLNAAQRELAIVEAICEALIEMGGKYVLPFRFKRPDGSRTSHHLIFVSKHPLGYKIMKGVMARESSSDDQGVPSFEYNPSYKNEGLLFDFARPLDELKEMLLETFAGKTLTMGEIYEEHNYGHRFIDANYKDVLRGMEEEELISCNPPAAKRQMRNGVRTFADRVEVTFPKKKR
ncbi:MAG: three-Cys-motif partner protein TcmP [Planctomycetes bacterium]|nr:three-Cys-motif partner protein TcmP [Planctomycetota bacterium]